MTSDNNLMRFGNKNGPLLSPVEYIERSIVRSSSSDCWLWTRAKQQRGYGVLEVNGKAMQAHRFAYQSLVGQIPAGMLVCHKCDVRACVNPEHLFLGTDADNLNDAYKKGRKGKLTAEKKAAIYAALDAGETTVAIATRFGVARSAVWYWSSRRTA